MDLDELIVDEEFQSIIPPLAPEEFNQLEQNIIEEDEVRDPIIVWQDHNIIVDGHNRYKVLLEHPSIPFRVMEKPFESREDVIVWMCSNQLGRRNLNENQRTILLGQAYEIRKAQRYKPRDEKGRFALSQQSADIRSSLADEYNVSVAEVERSGRYVRGLNEVEAVFPGTTRKITAGELEVTKKDVMSLTTMEGEEKQQAIRDIAAGRRIKPSESPSAPTEEKAEYTVEDFRSELMRKVSGLDKALELTCVLTHKDCLDTEEGKDALRDVLLEMTEVIKKYFEMCN